jgi:phosphate uptake regulator
MNYMRDLESYILYIQVALNMRKKTEYRKIQQVGRGSYILTLPKEWIQELNLEKGSQIAIRRLEDSSLLLIPRGLETRDEGKTARKECKIVVDSNTDPQSLCRKIASLYAVSVDIIHILFKEGEIPTEHRTAVHNLTKNLLLGSEIISETEDEIVIQILISHTEFPVEKAIRRMAVLALSANRDAVQALQSMDEELIRGVIEVCDDVNRLNLYVIRQLKYGLERGMHKDLGFRTPKEFLGYRIVANEIKNIADNALNIANNIKTLREMIKDQTLLLNEKVDEEVYSQILDFNSKAHIFFEDALKSLFKRDYNFADMLLSKIGSLMTLENELVIMISTKKIDPNISSIFRLILDSSRRIIECGRNIADVTLNRTVEEETGI